MDSLTFNMTLDILEGCKYSCMDCSVDRDLVIRDIPDEDVEQLTQLAYDMRTTYGAEMFEFAVGPKGCPHEFRCNVGDVKTIMRMLGVQECLLGVAHRHGLIPTEQPERYDRKERMYGNAQ